MAETLTKAKIAERIHRRIGLTKKESAELVDTVLDLVRDALDEGDRVKISGFGNFVVRDKAARRGRNPQTHASLIITRRRVLSFKPSAILRARLNEDRS